MSYIYGSPAKRKAGNVYNERSVDMLAIEPSVIDHMASVEWAIDAVVDIAQSVPGLNTIEVHTKLSATMSKMLVVFVPVESVRWEDFKNLSFPVGWCFESIALSMGQDLDGLIRTLRLPPAKARYVHFGFVVDAVQTNSVINSTVESMKAAILLHNPLRNLKWVFQHDITTIKQTSIRCDVVPAFTKVDYRGSRLMVQDSSGISRYIFSLGPISLQGSYVYRDSANLTQSSVTNAFVEVMRVKEGKTASTFVDMLEAEDDRNKRLLMPEKPFIRDLEIITARMTLGARTQRVRIWTHIVVSVVEAFKNISAKDFGTLHIGIHAATDDQETFLLQKQSEAILFSVDVISSMFDTKVSGLICLLDGACGLLEDVLPAGTATKADIRKIKESVIDQQLDKLTDMASASLKPQMFRQPSPVHMAPASQSMGFLGSGIKRQRTYLEYEEEEDEGEGSGQHHQAIAEQPEEAFADIARPSPVTVTGTASPAQPFEATTPMDMATDVTVNVGIASDRIQQCQEYVVKKMKAKTFAKVSGRGGIRYGPMYESLVQSKVQEEFEYASTAFGVTRAEFVSIVEAARK